MATGPALAGLPITRPEWLDREQTGPLVSFAESDYRGEVSEAAYRTAFPGATVSVRPMSLREIFVAQARLRRGARKGVAA